MGKYITKQRRALLEFLNFHKDEPLTISKIFTELCEKGISESAIYRNLAELEKNGEIKRVGQGENNEAIYRFSKAHSDCENAIHLSCKKCGKMYHLKSDTAESLKEKLTSGEDFQIDCSETVLYGICGKCKEV